MKEKKRLVFCYFLKNKQLPISIKLKTYFYGKGCSEKNSTNSLSKENIFQARPKILQKNLLLIYTNIAGGQAQELKTYFYEEKTVD